MSALLTVANTSIVNENDRMWHKFSFSLAVNKFRRQSTGDFYMIRRIPASHGTGKTGNLVLTFSRPD